MPFELFVALRYLKTRRKGLFSAATTVIGVAGVTIGTAALLTTLAVMNGFQSDIRDKIIGAQAHLVVHGELDAARRKALEEALAQDPAVEASAPLALGQAIVAYGGRSSGIVLKGLDPEREAGVNELVGSLSAGSWPKEGSKVPGLVLGAELARSLGAWVGDEVVLISPQGLNTPYGLMPAMQRFVVTGTARTGYYEYDSSAAYGLIGPTARFLKTPGGVSGMQARLSSVDLADETARRLQARLGPGFSVRSFSQMNQTLFAALKLEKTMMFIILALIILVASFNIASNLILLGAEKLRDIGLLRAMGAAPAQIRRVFLWVGLLVGGAGVLAGTGLGLLLCLAIAKYPIVELPADIYYLSKVPVRVDPADVASVVLCGLALALAATLYPAHRASRTDPLEAIRYG